MADRGRRRPRSAAQSPPSAVSAQRPPRRGGGGGSPRVPAPTVVAPPTAPPGSRPPLVFQPPALSGVGGLLSLSNDHPRSAGLLCLRPADPHILPHSVRVPAARCCHARRPLPGICCCAPAHFLDSPLFDRRERAYDALPAPPLVPPHGCDDGVDRLCDAHRGCTRHHPRRHPRGRAGADMERPADDDGGTTAAACHPRRPAGSADSPVGCAASHGS